MELIERFWREGFGHLRGDDVYTVGSCAALMLGAAATMAYFGIRNHFQRMKEDVFPDDKETRRL